MLVLYSTSRLLQGARHVEVLRLRGAGEADLEAEVYPKPWLGLVKVDKTLVTLPPEMYGANRKVGRCSAHPAPPLLLTHIIRS